MKTETETYKKFPPRIYRLYFFLKENCVGEERAMRGSEIRKKCIALYPEVFPKNYSTIKKDIKTIRNNFDREIGSSSSKGYWLITNQDTTNGIDYALRNCVSLMKTLVNSGISKAYFHQILNSLFDNKLADEQVVLPITPNTQKIAHRKSDDLL